MARRKLVYRITCPPLCGSRTLVRINPDGVAVWEEAPTKYVRWGRSDAEYTVRILERRGYRGCRLVAEEVGK